MGHSISTRELAETSHELTAEVLVEGI